MSEGEITMEKYERFKKLDREIHSLEIISVDPRNIRQLEESLKQAIKDAEVKYQKCKESTEKEKKDVEMVEKEKGVEEYLQKLQASGKSIDEVLDKERAEYLEALNAEQVVKREIDNLKTRLADLGELTKGNPQEKLQKLQTELDELLSSVFKGSYGSDLENRLESEHDMHSEKLHRIKAAKFKWENGKNLLHHAYSQLVTAVSQWSQIKPGVTNSQQVYKCATDTRNNLAAAKQNIENAQRYLDNIEFPYCKPPEMATLQKALENIYVDMLNVQRHQHALQCYNTTCKRSQALLQWLKEVIANIIEKDLVQVTKQERDTYMALKKERLKLMKEQLEKQGNKIDDTDDDLEKDEVAPPMPLGKPESAGDSKGGDNTPAPKAIPLKDLAPLPSKEAMFGDMEELTKQYEKDQQELQRAQEMNKARQMQGLEERLAAKRRKKKMQSEQ